MISRSEINRLAQEQKVRTSIIDKDWILGHFIDAIYSIPCCYDNLVFKGGTCLRKCRFPNYRFSEDLDFTSISKRFVFNLEILKNIVELVQKRSEIQIYIDTLENLISNNQLTGYRAKIKYWGADHSKNQQIPDPSRWQTSIKIEIITNEIMVFEPEIAEIIHNYSDQLTCIAKKIPIYSINEVLAEKIRALIQRSYTAPRDYYDLWYISRNINNIDWESVVKAFYKKKEYKNLHFSGIDQLINDNHDKVLKSSWINSLKHQVSNGQLSEYEIIRNDLKDLFERIF